MALTPDQTVSLVQDMLADPAAQKMLVLESQANEQGIASNERSKLVSSVTMFLWSAPPGKDELYRAYLRSLVEVLSDLLVRKVS